MICAREKRNEGHSRTEYMCENERETGTTIRMQGVKVKMLQEYKQLGSIVQTVKDSS